MSKRKRKKTKKQNRGSVPQGKTYMGELPNGSGFTLQLAANFGTEEPFVVRVWITISDILKDMKLKNKDEAEFRFDRVVELLDIARVHLGKIEDKNFSKLPTFDQQAEYTAFYNAIWWAYKDRFQLFMKELGFDIGFIFAIESKFESGTEKFLKEHLHAQQFINVARDDRAGWQNVLATHRNTMHTGDRRNEKHDANNPKDARTIFDNVWQAIEEHFVYLGEEIMNDGWTIAHIPEHQRDKTIPKRFIPYIKGLLDGTTKLPPLPYRQGGDSEDKSQG
jgi:hypothetical protein